MKKVILSAALILLSFLLIPSSVSASDDSDKQAVIIETDRDNGAFKLYLRDHFPFIEIVEEYQTLFNGLALRASAEELEQLDDANPAAHIHQVKNYFVTAAKKNDNNFLTPKFLGTQGLPYTGRGVKVGIIDTGIDYRHPDLRQNYRGGYDLVDLDEDPMETLKPQGVPTMHGTHVAGIIGANGKMKGIAPDVELFSYRALGPGGMGTSIQVIAAIEKAVNDGMDIINLSLGSSVNGPDWPTSIAVNRAAELGVLVVTANGNEGPGNWTVGSPATATKALSVGAVTSPHTMPMLFDNSTQKRIPLMLLLKSPSWELKKRLPIVDGGTGEKPLRQVKGKLVLFERGKLTFAEKARLAEKAGAAAAIIYNNETGGVVQGSLEDEGPAITIPVASISKQDGQWLLEHTVKEQRWIGSLDYASGDEIASFSSRGPVTMNWAIKPEIAAPGAPVMSTIPGGYQELQGTSMAAPYVAGALALIKEAHPDWTNQQQIGALLTTAKPLVTEAGTKFAPIEQGMGKMQPKAAIETPIIIENPLLRFGMYQNRHEHDFELVVHNVSEEPQDIKFLTPRYQTGVSWKLPLPVTVAPGAAKRLKIDLTVNPGKASEGIKQGWLQANINGKQLELPYLFVVKTADYPKIMGLEFEWLPLSKQAYRYQLYVPEGAKKLNIDLYDADTFVYQRNLLELKNQDAGLIKGTLEKRKAGKPGKYIALVTGETNADKNFSAAFPVIIER